MTLNSPLGDVAEDVPVVAFLVCGGHAWVDRPFMNLDAAERAVQARDDCSTIAPLVRQSDHLAALAKAQGEGWQDIETAPKDGTTVILAQGNNVLRGFYVVIAFEEKRDMDGRYIDQTDPEEFWMSEDGDIVEPDHWRHQPPLPAPPIPATSPAKEQA